MTQLLVGLAVLLAIIWGAIVSPSFRLALVFFVGIVGAVGWYLLHHQ